MLSRSQQLGPRFFISCVIFLLIFVLSGCNLDNDTSGSPDQDQQSQDGNNDQPAQDSNNDQQSQDGNNDQQSQDGNNDQQSQDSNNDQQSQDGNNDQQSQDGNNDQQSQDDTGNQPPNAKITGPESITSGETVTLKGNSSSDPENNSLSYQWTQTKGANIALSNSSSADLTFIAPIVTQATQYTFKLTVNDGELSNSATASIEVSPIVDNKPPSIVSKSPQPDQSGVSATGVISAVFDEALLESSVDDQSMVLSQNGAQISGAVSYDSTNKTIIYKPSSALSSGTTYTVTLASTINDIAGNSFTGDSWSFSTSDTDSGTDGDGKRLPQDGNPVHARFEKYQDYINKADNVLSYQLDCGGWPKNQSYDSKGNGGNGKGTFDNGATTMELTLMADAYKRTGETKYLESARKAMDYIFEAQYPEGGWPQFYPLKGGYADHVTFNDDAMSRTLTLLQKALDKAPPFDTDVLTDEQRSKLQGAIDGGVDYILKAQYVQNGKKTVWCAQHGKSDYEPKQGRSYEWPSLSGSESIEIIGFLMYLPQTPEVKEAVINAVNWFNSPDTYLQDYAYENDEFIPKEGSRVWARFHDLETNLPVFSSYDQPMYVGLEYQDKKKSGYRWGGTWGEKIISYAKSVGYID